VVAVVVPPTVSASCHLSLSTGPEHRLSLAAVGAPPRRQVSSGQRRRVVVQLLLPVFMTSLLPQPMSLVSAQYLFFFFFSKLSSVYSIFQCYF
jgi:hypothetical protein